VPRRSNTYGSLAAGAHPALLPGWRTVDNGADIAKEWGGDLPSEAGLDVALYVVAFRLLTPRHVPLRELLPGAVVGGIAYTVLLTIGTGLVQHQLRHAQAVYGQYAFVLGLMSWLYLVATLTLYAAESNVVRVRRLWPRSILQPPLTRADKQVLADIARQEERRPEESVDVNFQVPVAQPST